MPEAIHKRKEYLPYICVPMFFLLAAEIALVVLMNLGSIPLELGRRLAVVGWLLASSLAISGYAWHRQRAPVTTPPPPQEQSIGAQSGQEFSYSLLEQ